MDSDQCRSPVEHYYSEQSPEAQAHSRFSENAFPLRQDPDDESIIAGTAAYRAIERYLGGSDLYIVPQTRVQLFTTLKRYAYDAIHNAISHSAADLRPGGYSRVVHKAEESLNNLLQNQENVKVLLALHTPPTTPSKEDNRGFVAIKAK